MSRPRTDRRFRRNSHALRPASRAIEALEPRQTPATLLPGFTESVVASGLSGGTTFEFSPEGKLFVAEQAGTMEVWQGGTRLQANFFRDAPISTDATGERGLLGVTFDPNFATNRFVYVYYTTTAADRHNRVSRFTANAAGDLALAGSEFVVVDLDPHAASNHNGGAIHFGPDGKLYIAAGDNAQASNAQTLANRHGKILRLEPNGQIPADNPAAFDGIAGTPSGVNRAIWAVGLRNPYTFTFQPSSGQIWINDVGQVTWEEINPGGAGDNFGWPTTEGDFDPAAFPSFTRPIYAYSHGSGADQGFAITGGAFYSPTDPGSGRFPTSYDGDYFFADFGNDWIRVIDPATRAVSGFATNAPGVVDLRVTSDGSLYYLARGSGNLYRVTATSTPPGPQAPAITGNPGGQTVEAGGTASFTVAATGSTPLSYQWERAEAGTDAWAAIPGATASTYTLANVQAADTGDRFRVVVSNSAGSQTSSAATLTVNPGAATGLRAEFFDFARRFAAIPSFARRTPQAVRDVALVNYTATTSPWLDLDSRFADTFAARHTGYLRVETPGTYTIILASDDGSRLWLDGQILVNNDGRHGMRERSATVPLAAGYHTLRIDSFENIGQAGLELSWSGPGIARQVVPTGQLSRSTGSTQALPLRRTPWPRRIVRPRAVARAVVAPGERLRALATAAPARVLIPLPAGPVALARLAGRPRR